MELVRYFEGVLSEVRGCTCALRGCSRTLQKPLILHPLAMEGADGSFHQSIGCWEQTCAKVPKRFEILGLLSPRSGTLMDLGPCTSFLPWDSGNPGPRNCVMPQDPGNPGPQDFDIQ